MPMAQTSWKACRRSRHWSNRATDMSRARSEVRSGSSAAMGSSWWSVCLVVRRRRVARERDPDGTEHLDRDEKAREEEDDAEELANEEAARVAEPIQAARDGRDQ